MKPASVECYSGYKRDEKPLRFHDGECRWEIDVVLARWREPDAELFRVRAGGRTWVLRHELAHEAWFLDPA